MPAFHHGPSVSRHHGPSVRRRARALLVTAAASAALVGAWSLQAADSPHSGAQSRQAADVQSAGAWLLQATDAELDRAWPVPAAEPSSLLAQRAATPPRAAAAAPAAAAASAVEMSAMDATLFYQVLVGEMQLRDGNPGAAYQILLDAARRSRDDKLFARAVQVALQARAGNEALAAVTAWRAARPNSLDALRYQIQLLAGLNRVREITEPLRALIAQTPVIEQPALISALPGLLLQRSAQRKEAAALLEEALAPFVDKPGTRAAARSALGRTWHAAGDSARALELARRGHADDPAAPEPALLAVDLLSAAPPAEALVLEHLKRADASNSVRLAYARALVAQRRYDTAEAQLAAATRAEPNAAQPWLMLGALRVELKRNSEAQTALLKYLALRDAPAPATAAASAASAAEPDADADDPENDPVTGDDGGRTQAWMLLAQAAEQRSDIAAANDWLDKIRSPQRALEVQTRRAGMLLRQGKLDEARALVRAVPERGPDDARAKLLAEAQLLREAKRWQETYDLLGAASKRAPDDVDLLYEQAMAAEKMERLDEMERLLRRVIELKPDYQHAYNALGYSLADRNLRLDEARKLLAKALELAPGDPFITDSMGWVEFRLGNRGEAIRLLRSAYTSRPDAEIAAHLGEVLWSDGARDEARRVWREAHARDADNEVLRETLKRLKVEL